MFAEEEKTDGLFPDSCSEVISRETVANGFKSNQIEILPHLPIMKKEKSTITKTLMRWLHVRDRRPNRL